MIKLYIPFRNKLRYVKCWLRYLVNPYPEELSKSPVFIFNHIPKCAGTSFKHVLRNWFYIVYDYAPNENDFLNMDEYSKSFQFYLENPKDSKKCKPWVILAGHYHVSEFSLQSRYPNALLDDRYKLITFIRDPLKQKTSMYFFSKKMNYSFVEGYSLEDFLLLYPNLLANSLGCTIDNFKVVLKRYFFIGVVEKYEYSILQLSNKLNRKIPLSIPKSNVNEKKHESISLDNEFLVRFSELNKLDYLIYNYIIEKYYSN